MIEIDQTLDLLQGICATLEREAEQSQNDRIRLALATAESGILDAIEMLI